MATSNNEACPTHPVVREIMQRAAGGLASSPRSATKSGTRVGLVIEGGGMRGVYSAGALVALQELGLTEVFDEVRGESAGATNACFFLSGQASFGITIYSDYLASTRFVNPFRIGRMLDVDYAIDTVVGSLRPLDVGRVLSSTPDLFIGVTNARTGEPRTVDAKRDGVPLLTLLKASGALVPLYNRPVLIQGTQFVDGGIANPIPIRGAIERGCTHILVLLTRPPEFVARLSLFERLWLAPMCRNWTPEFTHAYFEQHVARYNQTRALAFGKEAAPPGVSIAVISPGPGSPKLSRTTIARKKLNAGIEDAKRRTHEAFRVQ